MLKKPKYNLTLRNQAQLGRQPPPADAKLPPAEIELWYALPGPIPGLGVNHGKVSHSMILLVRN